MTLTVAVQRLFYRYHADLLDTERRLTIIIPAVLADGTLRDWDWLFRGYGWEIIRPCVGNTGGRTRMFDHDP
jgi:hypothetical protein